MQSLARGCVESKEGGYYYLAVGRVGYCYLGRDESQRVSAMGRELHIR